jgi:flagellar motor switch protein FliM
MLNIDDIKKLSKVSGGSSHVVGFYSGDTREYDLFGAALNKDEKIKAAARVHENAAKSMSRYLSSVCGDMLEISFERHEMMTARESLLEVKLDQTILQLWQDPQSGSEGFIAVSKKLFHELFNIIFASPRLYEKQGELTALEKNVFIKISKPITESMQSAWRIAQNWTFQSRQLVADNAQLSSLHWNFDCFKAYFKIKHSDRELGTFYILLPREMLNSLAQDGAQSLAQDVTGPDKHWVSAVIQAIESKPIEFEVELAHIDVKLNSLFQIREDDVFILDIPERGHPAYLDGRMSYKASIGVSDGCRAVKVQKVLINSGS